MNDLQKSSLESPPPYNRSCSPLVLAKTTTTRTEVVTTTTTETTTHFFSLPHFRKRTSHSQPCTKDDYSNHKLSVTSLPSDMAMFEKALPPTPPNEIKGSQNDPVIIHSTQDLLASSPVAQQATDAVHFASSSPQTRSRAALTHPVLGKGKGLPHTSPAHLEINTIPFVSTASSMPTLTPTIRKSRSFQWLKRNVSESYAPSSNDDPPNPSASHRHRGLSFGANSSLTIGDKGKPTKVSPKPAPKPVSRRASFWSLKRGSPLNHPSHDEDILTMSTLPPVQHVPPFNISHLSEAPSFPIQTTATTHTAPFTDPSCNEPHETVASLPRPRAQTNPPFFRRFSMGVLSALEPSSPLDLRASNSTHLPAVTPTQAVHKPVIPKPLSKEESPDIYLTRLQAAVSKAEVAGILASRYVVSITYLHHIHSRTVRIHFMLKLFGHISINSTFLAFPSTLHCGSCSWK